jgi:hypothetical protein
MISEVNNTEPSPGTLEATAAKVRGEWAEKLDRIQIKGASDEDLEVFYTAMVHGLTYPSEQFEENRYYSAYDNQVHEGSSYTGYSIWVRRQPLSSSPANALQKCCTENVTGHIPCSMAMDNPLCSRKSSRNGDQYVERLQGSTNLYNP